MLYHVTPLSNMAAGTEEVVELTEFKGKNKRRSVLLFWAIYMDGLCCTILKQYLEKSDAWTPCDCESCKTVRRIQRASRCQLHFGDLHKFLYATVGVPGHPWGIFLRWDILQLVCYSEVLSWLFPCISYRVLREHETAETAAESCSILWMLCTNCKRFCFYGYTIYR